MPGRGCVAAADLAGGHPHRYRGVYGPAPCRRGAQAASGSTGPSGRSGSFITANDGTRPGAKRHRPRSGTWAARLPPITHHPRPVLPQQTT